METFGNAGEQKIHFQKYFRSGKDSIFNEKEPELLFEIQFFLQEL